MTTDRERFLAILPALPLQRGDAIVVLCGQDGEPRAQTAVELLRQNAAPCVVLSGGVEGEGLAGAKTLATKLLGAGVSPDRIIVEDESQNTHEQAVKVLDIAVENGWVRLLVVASPYHCYRAHLTFLRELKQRGLEKAIHLVMVPAAHLPWHGRPQGSDITRADLLALEMEKVRSYKAHVATPEEGLDYLKYWEAA